MEKSMAVIAKALKDIKNADWKTVAARPADFPPIPRDTRVTYLETVHNFYGEWALVKGPNGSNYYVDPSAIEIVDPWGEE